MNQNEDTLLMATIGLAFVLQGLAQAVWGVEVRRLDLGIGDFPITWMADNLGLFVSALDVTAGVVAAVLIIVLALLFSTPRWASACARWPTTPAPQPRSESR